MTAYGITRPTAAGVISMLFIGWAIGGSLTGWVSDYFGKRLPPMIVGSIGALISLCGILYVSHLSLIMMDILLFCFGLFSSGFLPSFSIVRETNSNENSATALGFMNMANMLGGAGLQPLIGLLLDFFWQGRMLDGVRVYSLTSYHIALTTLPVCIAIAILILPFIRETHGRSIGEE
jgi:MFS family permease